MNFLELLTQTTTQANSAWNLLIIAFFAGILVSFTPCIYPMIPVTAGILQGQASTSLLHNALSAIAYVIGIAFVYASLGYISATTSIIFGSWFASTWFLALVIGFFIYLALAMFGFYELYIPTFLSNQTTATGRPSLLRSLMLGIVSGTVASPCLTPALAILLGLVAKEANPMVGFTTLFSFAFGMSILLVLVGIFASSLTVLPRAGEWMNDVKHFLGFLMLGTCLYFLKPFFATSILTYSYALLSGCAAYNYFKYGQHPISSRIFGLLGLIGSILCLALATQFKVFN
jgi:thiol:disulfide interchange protein DsbD